MFLIDYVVDPLRFRSLKTFMIYLNDDYEAGETNFSDEHDMYLDKDRGIYCSPEERVFARFKATTGDCLVFDHKLLHEGQQVLGACKYIMRTDVMFEKQLAPGVTLSDEEVRTEAGIKEYYEGMALEEGGQVDQAIVHYKRAYKLCPDVERHF